jgi:hypothetical protein
MDAHCWKSSGRGSSDFYCIFINKFLNLTGVPMLYTPSPLSSHPESINDPDSQKTANIWEVKKIFRSFCFLPFVQNPLCCPRCLCRDVPTMPPPPSCLDLERVRVLRIEPSDLQPSKSLQLRWLLKPLNSITNNILMNN